MTFLRSPESPEWLRLEARLPVPLARSRSVLAWLALSLGALGLSTLPAHALCGGVIALAYNQTPTNKVYLRVILAPPEAVQAGAGWRLSGNPNAPYITNSDLFVQLTNNGLHIEFNTNVPGWDPPAFQGVALTNELNAISNVPYLHPSRLDVTPAGGLISTGYAGGPFSPAGMTYTLANPGESCVVSWTITKTADWLDVSSTNGWLNPGASTNVAITVNTNANRLDPGIYPGALAFMYSTTSGGGSTFYSVSLTVAVLKLINPQWQSNHISMALDALPNRVYSIQFSTNLFNWTDLLLLTNSTGTNVFTNTPSGGSTNGFYRAKEQP